jgi:trimeric autotransporter adhesin
MSKLIGTNPNQVPSNADLGTAAFMDKKEFLLSKGSEMSAIEAVIPKTAVDVFIYDTTKDSDGGAWRKRVQHTSWYNERLNTTTRGSRKEFPAVAVIVAEAAKITIYDGDDPDMPMWMVFNQGQWYHVHTGGASLTSVHMLNGMLCWTGFRLGLINFIKDATVAMEVTWYNTLLNPIAGRNLGAISAVNIGFDIANNYTVDVAMTVLPNAPIDSATGLPIPTIAVATNNGVSVIRDSGQVYDINYSAANSYNFWSTVKFTSDYKLIIDGNFQGLANNIIHVVDIPNADFTGNTVNARIAVLNGRYYHSDSSKPNISLGGTFAPSIAPMQKDRFALGGDNGSYGLDIIDEAPETVSGITSDAMVAYIKSDYNTGWMNGDIKLATLSDTDTTNAVSANMAGNGNFADTSVWGPGNGATLSVSGNVGTITGNGSTAQAYIGQTVSGLTVGKQYMITCDVKRGTTTAQAAITVNGILSAATTSASFVPLHVTFTATATSQLVLCFMNGTGSQSGTALFQNFTFRLAEADRSVNGASPNGGNALQVFGTVTKTAVATGADLVAYSGFNTTAGYSPNGNRLQQPYNSGYNFTGDFSISYWVKGNDSDTAIHWSDASGNDGWHIYHNVNTSYFLDGTWDSFSAYQQVDSVTSLTGAWTRVDYVRRGGSLCYYLDAVLKHTYNGIGGWALTNTTAHQLAVYAGNTTNAFALLRISATAPSAEQIKKMYNDEKYLFQDNAKCTLYGTSNSVTALAYDDTTDTLHAGGPQGRSDFQGLRRINNTTRAIGTAISAVDGFIVEE